jgi:hypothetical protein
MTVVARGLGIPAFGASGGSIVTGVTLSLIEQGATVEVVDATVIAVVASEPEVVTISEPVTAVRIADDPTVSISDEAIELRRVCDDD